MRSQINTFQFCKDGWKYDENHLVHDPFFQYSQHTSAHHEDFVMIVTAWKNGTAASHASEYGLQLAAHDRDRYFCRDWDTIELEFEGYAHVVKVNVGEPSFWNSGCRELVHVEIGRWLIDNGLGCWNAGKPPKLSLKFIGGNRFRLMR